MFQCLKLSRVLACAFVSLAAAAAARADDVDLDHPPFDFSDAFYLQHGIDPSTLVGRPDGTPPGSVIDDTENGPDFNNVRILDQAAAFDDSGHPIFFYVTGLPVLESFLDNAAGDEAFAVAEKHKVYEFPRAANPPLSVFPKRQDLVADLSGGYFSDDPLGIWQINLVRFTPAALDTAAGQAALAELAADNGTDLDGTPVIRTKSEVLSLQSKGFVTIETPPVGFGRWFFCPVLKDPQGGEIAPDAHLTIVSNDDGTPLAAEKEIADLFHCLQSTDQPCDAADAASVAARAGMPANPVALSSNGAPILGTTWSLSIDHAAFVPASTLDVLLLGATQVNLKAGLAGTLLVSPFVALTGTPGQAFDLGIPLDTALVGLDVTAQGASKAPGAGFHLTNALDAQVGTH
jgi:hypothetical protein